MTTIYVIAAIVVVLIALGHIQFRAWFAPAPIGNLCNKAGLSQVGSTDHEVHSTSGNIAGSSGAGCG